MGWIYLALGRERRGAVLNAVIPRIKCGEFLDLQGNSFSSMIVL
jgi:hypothetical protein